MKLLFFVFGLTNADLAYKMLRPMVKTMNKKNVFMLSLVFTMPFFVKGIHDAHKDNKDTTMPVFQHVETLNKHFVEPLPTDYKPAYHALIKLEQKAHLYHELGYDVKPIVFKIDSSKDIYVRYTRPDGTGFVRNYGSRTWRNMNPGAIRTSPFARNMGACGDAGGFAVFPSEEQGMIALKALLRTDAYANLSIYNAIHKYAPFCDNNDPVRYQNHLYARTGINVNRKLGDLSDEELDKIAETIKVLEGWKVGNQEAFGFLMDVFQEIIGQNKQYTR